MRHYLIKSILLILCSFSLTLGHAQKKYIQKAEVAAKSGDYQRAVLLMEQGMAQGYVLSDRESLGLAELYYTLGQYGAAVNAYKVFYERGLRDTPSALLHYAHALKASGEPAAAAQMINKGKELYPEDVRFAHDEVRAAQERAYFENIHQLTDSLRSVIQLVKDPQGQLYGTDISDTYDQLWTKPNGGSPSLVFESAKYNQGGVTFSPDGQTMYAAVNAHRNNKLSLVERTYSPLQIYRFSLRAGQWVAEEKTNVSSEQYSTSSPALSADGKTLYFVSDRPGGMGETDIYRAALLDQGRFGPAELLDRRINTPGRESHVFVDQDNILYFSSDGQPGLGGLDVFALDLNDPEAQAYNLGAPINTSFDDFAYSIRGLSGFVSSNRGGLTQSYGFSIDQPLALAPKFDVQVALTNTHFAFGTPLELTLYNNQGAEVWNKTIKPDGESAQVVIEGLWKQGYRLTVSGEHIVAQEHLVTVSRQQKSWSLTAAVVSKNKPEINFLDQFGLSPILFDFNQSVTEVADLKTLADRLQYAQSIILEGHSDQIGTARYNKRLSLKRAEFIKQALVDAGVKATLIQVVGYGEKRLLNNCRASRCSPEQEQANRRVEIKAVF